MSLISALSVAIGAAAGALLRWGLGILFNPIFPAIPLGTLSANLLGGFLIGIFMALTRNHLFFSEAARLAITTGFLGGLTTFSTFSAETVTLLSHKEFLMSLAIICVHVVGSIFLTLFGIIVVKLVTM